MASPTPPSARRRAVIDVGTNSVKLLVADVSAGAVEPILETSHVTRLGRGFYETHLLQPEAIRHTAEAVKEFAGTARAAGADSLRIIATSAARDARNGSELTEALHIAAGVAVEIISGNQEADWVFRGVTTDAKLGGMPLCIMDLGGGSTEFIVGEHGHAQFRHSFQLGVVRELERLRPEDPPAAGDLARCREHIQSFIRAEIAPRLQPELQRHNPSQMLLVGVGGSATVLAAMQLGLREFRREALEGFALRRSAVDAWVERLWSLPLAQRQAIPGLPARRADVILAGAVIYAVVMREFGFETCRVSTRGLRYAALLEEP